MRAVIQRVTRASVTIEEKEKTKIGNGFLVLLGIEDADSTDDVSWLAGKIAKLRVFSDAEGLMNLSLDDIHGDIIVVSQFTLFAATKKGNRPSYIRAARPEKAIPLYELFVKTLQTEIQGCVQTGEFGADMKVDLLNDGPVTIIIDTKNKE
jgi:D-tyrosyl-tRNA(Tyr) deacylase